MMRILIVTASRPPANVLPLLGYQLAPWPVAGRLRAVPGLIIPPGPRAALLARTAVAQTVRRNELARAAPDGLREPGQRLGWDWDGVGLASLCRLPPIAAGNGEEAIGEVNVPLPKPKMPQVV